MDKNKIVIEEREDGVLIGINKNGVDPFVRKMDLTFPQMLDQMPFVKGVYGIAEEQWAVAPKNPAYDKPVVKTANEKAGLPKVDGKTKAVKLTKKTKVNPIAETIRKDNPEAIRELTEQASTDTAVKVQKETTPTEQASMPRVQKPAEAQKETPLMTSIVKNRVSADEFQYRLKDGRGPFNTIQAALDAIGADKKTRPMHNRYDRLSKKLREEIKQEKK